MSLLARNEVGKCTSYPKHLCIKLCLKKVIMTWNKFIMEISEVFRQIYKKCSCSACDFQYIFNQELIIYLRAIVIEHSTEISIHLGLQQQKSKLYTIFLGLYTLIYIYIYIYIHIYICVCVCVQGWGLQYCCQFQYPYFLNYRIYWKFWLILGSCIFFSCV